MATGARISVASTTGGGGQYQQPIVLDTFEIVLNNSEEVYFAGQEISGKVVLECREPMQLNEILFEVKGRARTFWTTKSRKNCSANEAYFCEQFNTAYTHKLPPKNPAATATGGGGKKSAKAPKEANGGPAAGQPQHLGRTLPAGLHEIPFSYTLPKHLPTSFEGDFGFVRYTCRAICERPWDFDIVCFRAFTVIGIEDLNHEAEILSLPLETRNTEPVTFVCMKLGSVVAELRLAKGGFTPGEDIPVCARVHNTSRRVLRGLELRLCQTVEYKSKTFDGAEQCRTVRHVVHRVPAGQKRANVRPGASFAWTDQPVPVPSVPPRLLTKCKLIRLSYALELNCASPKWTLSLPVVIGTIPLLPGILAGKMANGGAANSLLSKGMSREQVQVTVTDETGKKVDGGAGEEEDRMDPETERACVARKRVRMPSSVLSELYPALQSPYYRELYSGPVCIADDKERKFQFGHSQYAPKYPFYE